MSDLYPPTGNAIRTKSAIQSASLVERFDSYIPYGTMHEVCVSYMYGVLLPLLLSLINSSRLQSTLQHKRVNNPRNDKCRLGYALKGLRRWAGWLAGRLGLRWRSASGRGKACCVMCCVVFLGTKGGVVAQTWGVAECGWRGETRAVGDAGVQERVQYRMQSCLGEGGFFFVCK